MSDTRVRAIGCRAHTPHPNRPAEERNSHDRSLRNNRTLFPEARMTHVLHYHLILPKLHPQRQRGHEFPSAHCIPPSTCTLHPQSGIFSFPRNTDFCKCWKRPGANHSVYTYTHTRTHIHRLFNVHLRESWTEKNGLAKGSGGLHVPDVWFVCGF